MNQKKMIPILNLEVLLKKINEEIHTVKTKIPGFILIDFLRCLENLNQTNFNIQYQENSFFTDNKYQDLNL